MMSSTIGLAWRMLRRDWRAGEMRVLAIALVIAVAAVTSVNVFTDRIEQGLEQQANALLGADLVIDSASPISDAYAGEGLSQGLDIVHSRAFPSMVMTEDDSQLVALKAVSDGYPLRGVLRITEQLFAPDHETTDVPTPGTVWADPRLLIELNLNVGDRLMVGALTLPIAAVLTSEPSRASGNLFALAPRLLIHLDDLEATQLIQPASRLKYQLYLAGDEATVTKFRPELENKLQPGERLLGIEDGRPEVRKAMERAQRFLSLAALVSVVLAGVAVAMAAQRFVSRHLDHCAVMRCIGATQPMISKLYTSQLLVLGLVASAVGVLLGYASQAVLVSVLGDLIGASLPAPSFKPALWGELTGLITLLGFALPPLIRLKNVPALRVLRRDLDGASMSAWLVYAVGIIALAVVVFLQIGDVKLSALALGGTALTFVVLALFAYGLVSVIRAMGHKKMGIAWRFGLAGIARRPAVSVVQVVGFGLGIMALLLLGLVRADLLGQWQERVPVDAPNRFLINIQPQQVDAMKAFLVQRGVTGVDLHPMIRARLIAHNGEVVEAQAYDNDRAQRLANREFNISWAANLQKDNELVQGEWWQGDDALNSFLSVEVGIAQSLGWHLGDTVSYRVAGQEFTGRIYNLRRVNWDSFQANFFVIGTPALLEKYPATYITSFYLPDAQSLVLNELVREFPNITVIDVATMMNQVRMIIERVTLAVEYVFGFTLLAGLMVMYAAVHASLDERIRETAVLRTLGARRKQLLQGLITEFVSLGLLAGTVAATAATLIAYILSTHVFELPFELNMSIWVIGVICGALGIGVAGTLSIRHILGRPPLQSLRG